MSRVFVYLDNSNIFPAAQDLAEERNGDANARYRVRIHFENLLRLAHADRPMAKAMAAGSIPPALSMLWNRLRRTGVEVHLYDRGAPDRGEQEAQWLQLRMLEDTADYLDNPGIVALDRRRSWLQRRPGFSQDAGADAPPAGGWNSCRGSTPLTRECWIGWRPTASLCRWTITTTPSPTRRRHASDRNRRRRATRWNWTCLAGSWRDRGGCLGRARGEVEGVAFSSEGKC